MDRKIKVSARALAGVLPFVCKEETRYYLNGVQIEPAPQGGVYCIATDGHTLAVTYDSAGDCNRGSGWICPIRGEVAYKLGQDYIDEQWLVYFHGQCCYLTHAETTRPDIPSVETEAMVYAPPIDGTFPMWRRVLPKALKLDAGVTVDARLIARFEKVVRVLAGNRTPAIRLLPSDNTGPLVVIASNVDNFFGLVMPMRYDSFPSISWLEGFDLMSAIEAGKAAGANGQAASENGQAEDPGQGEPAPAA